MNDARRVWPATAGDHKQTQGGTRSASGALKSGMRGLSFDEGDAQLKPAGRVVQCHLPEVETRAQRIAQKVAALRKRWLRAARGEALGALLGELEACDAPLIAEVVAALLPEIGGQIRPVVRVLVMTDVAFAHLREAIAFVAALPRVDQEFGAALAASKGRKTNVLFTGVSPEAQAKLAEEEHTVASKRAEDDAAIAAEDDRSEAATVAAGTGEVATLAAPIRQMLAAGAYAAALRKLCEAPEGAFDGLVHTLDDGAVAALLAGLSFDDKWNTYPQLVGRVLGARSPEANAADALALAQGTLSPDRAYAAFRFLKALPPAHRDRFAQIHPELMTHVHMSLNESMRAAADTNFFGGDGKAQDTVAALLGKLSAPATWQTPALMMTLAALLKAGERAAVLAHIEQRRAAICADAKQRGAVDDAFDHACEAADADAWFASLAACGKLDTKGDTLVHGTMETFLGKDGVTAAIGQANRAHNAKTKAAKKAAKAAAKQGGEAYDPKDFERHDLLEQLGGKGETKVDDLPLDQLDLAIDSFGEGADIVFEDHGRREPGDTDTTNLADVGFDRNAGTLHVACADLALERVHVPHGAITVDSGRATMRDLVIDATFPTAQHPEQRQALHVSAAGLDVADVFFTTPSTLVGVAHIGARALDFTMAEAALGLGDDPDINAALALVVRHNPSRNLLSAIAQYAGSALGLGKAHDNSAGELNAGLGNLAAALTSFPVGALGTVNLALGALEVEGVVVDAATSVDTLHVDDLLLDVNARPSVLGERRLAQLGDAPRDLAERDRIDAALPRWRALEALWQDLYEARRAGVVADVQGALLSRGQALGFAATTLDALSSALAADLHAGSGTIASVGAIAVDGTHGDTRVGANATGVAVMAQGDRDALHTKASAEHVDLALGNGDATTTLSADDANASLDSSGSTLAAHVDTGAIAYGDGETTVSSGSAALDVTGDAHGTHATLNTTDLDAHTALGDGSVGTLDVSVDLPSLADMSRGLEGPISLTVSAGPIHLPNLAYGAGAYRVAAAAADADLVTASVCVDVARTATGSVVEAIAIDALSLPTLSAQALEVTLPIEGQAVTIALPKVILGGLKLSSVQIPGVDAAAFMAATGRVDLAALQIGLSDQLAFGLRASGALVCNDLYAESFDAGGDLKFGFGDLALADLGLDRESVVDSPATPPLLAAILARGGTVRHSGPVTLDATVGRSSGALAATVALGTIGLGDIHYRAPGATLDVARADLVNVSLTASAQLGAQGLEALAITRVAADEVVGSGIHYDAAVTTSHAIAEGWDGKPGTVEHRHDSAIDLDHGTLRKLVVTGLASGGISATQFGLSVARGDVAGFEAALHDNGRQVLHATADADVKGLTLEVDGGDTTLDAERVRGDADVQVGDAYWDKATTSLTGDGVVAHDVHGAMHDLGKADERVELHAKDVAADHFAVASDGTSVDGKLAAEDVGYGSTKDLDGNVVTKAHAGSVTASNVEVRRVGATPTGPDEFSARLPSATVRGFEAAALADASGLVTLHADEVLAPFGGAFSYGWTPAPAADAETYAQEQARVASERQRRDALRQSTKDLLAHIDGALSFTCLIGNPPLARTFTVRITDGLVDMRDVAIFGGAGLDVDWSIDADGRIIAVLDTAGFGDVYTLAESSAPDAADDDPLLERDAADSIALNDLVATQATDVSSDFGDQIAIYDTKIGKLEKQLAGTMVLDRQTKTKALANYRRERAQLIAEHDRAVTAGADPEAGPAHVSFTNIGAQLHWDSEAPVQFGDFTIGAQSIDLTFVPDGLRYRAEAALAKVAVAKQDGSLAMSLGEADVGFALDGIVPEGRVDVVGGEDTPLARNPMSGRLHDGARLVDVDVTLRKPAAP